MARQAGTDAAQRGHRDRAHPARTGRSPEVREVEALNLAAIAAARDTIYVENQYLASRTIADALAARLREADGPEIVIVLARKGNNPLERGTMDSARHLLLHQLWGPTSMTDWASTGR